MSPRPTTPSSGSASANKTTDELMHAIRNQLGLIAGHASLLLAESAEGSKLRESAEIISRACFTVSDQLQALGQQQSDSN